MNIQLIHSATTVPTGFSYYSHNNNIEKNAKNARR